MTKSGGTLVLWDYWDYWYYFVKQTDSNAWIHFYNMFIVGSL